MPMIVFVCTRNRFRSPLAAAILKRELETRNIPGEWIVASAGSWVKTLLPPTPDAFVEAGKRCLNLSSHTSQGIEAFELDKIDLLLVMELGQKESILLDFPQLKGKTYLLSELSGPAFTIPDPYVTKEPCTEIAIEIETLIKDSFYEIINLVNRKTQ